MGGLTGGPAGPAGPLDPGAPTSVWTAAAAPPPDFPLPDDFLRVRRDRTPAKSSYSTFDDSFTARAIESQRFLDRKVIV